MAYDLLVKDGRIVDGAGKPWYRADVGIIGDTISAIGRLGDAPAHRVIRADDRIVCPGLVDIHDHADGGLVAYPEAPSLVRQGVTTAVIGNCGLSPAPICDATKSLLLQYIAAFYPGGMADWHSLAEFLQRLEAQGVACNVAPLVGHGSIRIAVMGFDAREPTPPELHAMCALTRQAMAEGAFGLSTGLAYAPGLFASTEEVVALAREAAACGGYYATHVRSEGAGWLDSIREAIAIGERAGLPVQVSHIEPHYPNFGLSSDALALVDDARARGLDVTFDVPPYLMGMTTITIVLPNWVQGGGIPRLVERLRDPDVRARIKAGEGTQTNPAIALARDGRWSQIRLVDCQQHPELVGLDLAEIARRRGQEPYDAVFDLLIAEGKQLMIVGAFHDEEDLCRVVAHPYCMVESDEGLYDPEGAQSLPHPRAFGTFPLLFRKYVRGETRAELPEEVGSKLLTWEEAVRKVTSLPAARLGLQDRGLLREGMRADLVLLDPARVCDGATYDEPMRYPEGVDWVLVNGTPVVEEGQHTGALPGRVLRKRVAPARRPLEP